MSWFNSLLAGFLPYVPKRFIYTFAKSYVAGESEDDAIRTIRYINDQGFSATVDILGEHTSSTLESNTITERYCHLYDRIREEGLDCNISLKLTHIGLEVHQDPARENLFTILNKAQEVGNFLRIDMENSPYTDRTISLYKQCLARYNQVGTVFQAYLHRSHQDVQSLMGPQFNVRICKGIYKEPASIAYQDRESIRDNFVTLVKTILSGDGTVGIATHDLRIINEIESWVELKKVDPARFEFQVLYGVPMGNRLNELLKKGYRVRIYIPFGEAWFDYSIRRLKENPYIIGYILRNLLKRRLDRL